MKNLLPHLILLIILLILGPLLFAQTPQVKYGDAQFHQFNFKLALEIYKGALKKDTGNVYLKSRIADCYRLTGDHVSSEPYYAALAANNAVDPLNKLYYAQALRYNKKYDQAGTAYQSYMAYTNRPSASIEECIVGTKELGKLKYDDGRYLVENLLDVNTDGSDFAPTYFVDKHILFTSNRDAGHAIVRRDNWTGSGFLKAYTTSSLGTRVYSEPKALKARHFNNRFHEGPMYFSTMTNELYITRSNADKKKPETVKTKLYKVVCDPKYGYFQSDISEAVSFNSDQYSVMHPTITADGTTMYFASDMPAPDAQGGMDIYVATRNASGAWGTPKNLGSYINTLGDDMFPFISADSALYFASDGHAGLGGLDVYRSYMLPDGSWSRPRNLGAPINTNFDDFSYVMDEKGINGLFSSDRPGGKGGDDIYSFVRKEINLVGQVLDQATLQPVEDVKITLKEDAGTIPNTEDQSDRRGGFCFSIKPKTQYTMATSKLGYAAREVPVVTREGTTRRTIYITRIGAVNLLVNIEDAVTHRPIKKASGVITDIQTGENAQFLTDATGVIFADIVIGHQYKIDVDKKPAGDNKYYLSEVKVVSSETLVNGDTLKVTMGLNQNTVNYVASLKNIYFDLDKYNIRPDAALELDKVVATLRDNPSWRIQVAAHTDCREGDQYNMQLSQRRANSTVAYLESKGIQSLRLAPKGFGKTRPAISCDCSPTGASGCSEEQHQMNRRVEFVILNTDALSQR